MKCSDSTFYPAYIPGESVYSWVARLHLSRPSPSWKNTNRLLFGKENVRLHSVIPAHLEVISQHSQVPVETLLFNATGFSLFAYMQGSVDWAESLKKALISENGSRIATLASHCSSKLPFHSCLKFCPECLEIDRATNGIAYWHTEHQLYGVWACPTHGLRLIERCCGDGGVNHTYVLPEYSKGQSKTTPKVLQKLSTQIARSYNYLNAHGKPIFPSTAYSQLLQNGGYLTDAGHLRWVDLQREMQAFWHSLFEIFPLDEQDRTKFFQFVPTLVHTDKRVHYFKHFLLICFLFSDIQNVSYASPKSMIENKRVLREQISNSAVVEASILKLINQGESLREISKSVNRSIGYLIQLARRNSIQTERRSKFITPDIERSIWRQAFMGKHRSEIAENHNCSVGAVEHIIQSHYLLSKWRAHIRHVNQLRKCRTAVLASMQKHPNAPRNEIQKLCRSEYTWLYKFDHNWLYENLPPKLPKKYQRHFDWVKKDDELAKKITAEIDKGTSLSAIDRQLGAHGWLTRYKDRFPKSVKVALDIINTHRLS